MTITFRPVAYEVSVGDDLWVVSMDTERRAAVRIVNEGGLDVDVVFTLEELKAFLLAATALLEDD